jgi:hypothetical protein
MSDYQSVVERSRRLQTQFETIQREIVDFQTRLQAHRRALTSYSRLKVKPALARVSSDASINLHAISA